MFSEQSTSIIFLETIICFELIVELLKVEFKICIVTNNLDNEVQRYDDSQHEKDGWEVGTWKH